MLLGAHNLAGTNILDGLSIRVNVALFLGALCLSLCHHLSGNLSGALLRAVTALDVFAAHLHLAQGALHLAQGGLERSVERIFLCFGTGDVSLTRSGDLDAIRFRIAARVRLVLQLHVEEGQGGVKAFNLGQLVIDSLLKVIRDLDITARNRYLSFVWLGH